MFARLPVGPAIRWLETFSSKDPKVLIDFAAERTASKATAMRSPHLTAPATLKLDAAQKRRLDELTKLDRYQGGRRRPQVLPLDQERQGRRLDRRVPGLSRRVRVCPAAQRVMAAFAELRKTHDVAAKKAFGEARQLFQQGNQDGGYAKYKEIVEKSYASSLYRVVKRSLDER